MRIFKQVLVDPFLECVSNADPGNRELLHEFTLCGQHLRWFELTIGNTVGNIVRDLQVRRPAHVTLVFVTDTKNKDH